VTGALLALSGIVKDYHALRPLRVERLLVQPGEQVAIVGVDQPWAEVFVNIVTGAVLPDRGEVVVFGRSTADIGTGDEWLATADRFGIVSERAVLLESLSLVQNLAVPFSLEIEPPPPENRERAERLAAEVGLSRDLGDRRVGDLGPELRARVRLARGLALDPEVLLIEHPTAGLAREAVVPLARQMRTVSAGRGVASVFLTADREFATAAASRVLSLDPASGRLAEAGRWWFSRRD
jgi:predicted ABC-type transport system involved in lysophospholipase L1 biosynthesis ATPase subunit